MALIQCPECGLPVSSKGAACPRCAYPIQKLTNLFQATKQNDIEMVKDLLKSGADPNITDNEGASPLMIASYYGHEVIANLLLQAGAYPNLKRGRGVTALMDAAYRGHTLLVRALLDAGANPAIVSETGISAIELAKKKRRLEIKALLEQAVLQQELKEMQETPHAITESMEDSMEDRMEDVVESTPELPPAEEEETPEEAPPAVTAEAVTAEVKMPELISCLKCDDEIGLEDLTCPHCGTPILRRYCGRCSRLIPDHLQVCPFCKTSDDRNFRYRPNVEGAVITGIVAITLGVWIVAQSWVQPSHQSNPTNPLVYTELASELATSLRPGEKTIQPSAAARTELYTPKPFPDALLASPHEGSTAAHLQQPHLNTPEAKKEAQKGRIETQSVTIQAARSQQLNAIGFALMKQGRYEEATRVLMEAVKTFPESQRNLNYAYALYNLGRALRLAGHPDSAIPFLEERLKYNDQRDVVQRELIAARRDAGDPSAWGVRYE